MSVAKCVDAAKIAADQTFTYDASHMDYLFMIYMIALC